MSKVQRLVWMLRSESEAVYILHVQVHVGQGAPAEAPAAALPAGINCQTSPDGTQV